MVHKYLGSWQGYSYRQILQLLCSLVCQLKCNEAQYVLAFHHPELVILQWSYRTNILAWSKTLKGKLWSSGEETLNVIVLSFSVNHKTICDGVLISVSHFLHSSSSTPTTPPYKAFPALAVSSAVASCWRESFLVRGEPSVLRGWNDNPGRGPLERKGEADLSLGHRLVLLLLLRQT